MPHPVAPALDQRGEPRRHLGLGDRPGHEEPRRVSALAQPFEHVRAGEEALVATQIAEVPDGDDVALRGNRGRMALVERLARDEARIGDHRALDRAIAFGELARHLLRQEDMERPRPRQRDDRPHRRQRLGDIGEAAVMEDELAVGKTGEADLRQRVPRAQPRIGLHVQDRLAVARGAQRPRRGDVPGDPRRVVAQSCRAAQPRRRGVDGDHPRTAGDERVGDPLVVARRAGDGGRQRCEHHDPGRRAGRIQVRQRVVTLRFGSGKSLH